MKLQLLINMVFVLFISSSIISAQNEAEIISLYEGSELIFDDDIGYETHYYLSDASTIKSIDGTIIRKFCSAPAEVSPLEIIKNYEKAITDKGGTIIHISSDAFRFTNQASGERVWFMRDYFTNGRENRTNHYGYMQVPNKAEDYVVGKLLTSSHDIYISVASAVIESVTYYTLVILQAEPMDMNNVTLNVLNEGIAANGRVAIYDIYFDTGKSEVKAESALALSLIADYLKSNIREKYLIVGHTDNTGDFSSNLNLSQDRAIAVIDKLVQDFGISDEQLIPYGVGSTSPQVSNSTEEGRSRNRRVEMVEY